MKQLKLMVPTYVGAVVTEVGKPPSTPEAVEADFPLTVQDSTTFDQGRLDGEVVGRISAEPVRDAHRSPMTNGDDPEFGDPRVPVLVHEADGIRIVLGSHADDDSTKPDLQIERRKNGWAIFLHPVGGSDPSGHVYFLDDGRSFVVRESGYGPTPPIRMLVG